jgi:hypothetical protein
MDFLNLPVGYILPLALAEQRVLECFWFPMLAKWNHFFGII